MSWFYERLVRPALFTQDAEIAHERTMRALSMVSRNDLLAEAVQSFYGAPPLPVELFGFRFPNPVGLAAGMDKYGNALPAWQTLGFGFTELGAVTRHGQPGNPPPRLFRAVPEEAIVNRMGFNNDGAEAMGKALEIWRSAGKWPKHPVGVNLGKSKMTPLESAAEDYAFSVRVLLPYVDFFVVNVSSPNTPNLRQLQDKAALAEILKAIAEVQKHTPVEPRPSHVPRPVLVKVSPDLSFEALDDLLDLATSQNLAGIVATNTTTTRPKTERPEIEKVYSETGGLSGAPLRQRSTEVIRHIYRQTKGKLPIIGVGGIFNADHAWEKITAGASLIQVYTGLVYKGPTLAKDIMRGLLQRLEAHGAKSLSEVVGSV
jgi:dihydroorotate dehydrogenase